ncbi:DnaJ domain [Dillenia turbinata]|uniref:DnaJ domain n=1 Tax=Dillenia turbinata TaxID=194707 RepID=A0AAN8YZH5_9MAGN
METNIEEALRAKEIAEKRFAEKDFAGAKNYALKAKTLYPELEGIAQMLATFDIYIASEVKINGEIDFYSVLGLKPSANKDVVKKHYKKLAVMLHPDKNKTVGADGAFKLVSEAWTLLSDSNKRSSYDHRRNKQYTSSHQSAGFAGYENCSVSHAVPPTFWTICTSCNIQYEYLRKYVNKRLSCKNCRGVFIAVETGSPPPNGSYPCCSWSYSYAPSKGYGGHGFNGVTYVPTNNVVFSSNGIPGYHSGHSSECVSNVSFQWNSMSGNSAGAVEHRYADAMYQANGTANVVVKNVKLGGKNKYYTQTAVVDMGSNVLTGYGETGGSKTVRPYKKRKVDNRGNSGCEEMASKNATDLRMANGNGNVAAGPKLSSLTDIAARRSIVAPAFDTRKFLIDKARTHILKKLEEINLASAAVAAEAAKKAKVLAGVRKSAEATNLGVAAGHHPEPRRRGPVSISVPDSDFHDFDKDRSEDCFKPKQIWAIYDEEDGMPRLYCLIREVISVKPFKIHITYLNSKTDAEFGSVNWIDSGFTKSCGNFRAWNSDVVEQVNIFSHVLNGEKAGRGGCVRIYPKSGDIWAVYRNWSPEWNRSTPDEVRHQYEMVEVLDDYSEDLGVCVTPLIKLEGFKTVYQRNASQNAIRWIARREMLRFSHKVPSWSLKGEENNLPDGCWDLDPAATPEELLQVAMDADAEPKVEVEN